MPPRNTSVPSARRRASSPPPVMTWAKATPVLIVGGIFDALRFMCEMFWFFGPAIAALYCAISVSDLISKWTFGFLGAGTAAAICASIAATAGAAAVEATAPIGVVLAMAVGFAGWITIGGWLLITNRRIFKENSFSFAASLAVSEVPLLGAVPALTFALWRMYRTQIRIEKAAFKKYEEGEKQAQLAQQREQAVRGANLQALQQQQLAQQEEALEEDTAAAERADADAEPLYEIPEPAKPAI